MHIGCDEPTIGVNELTARAANAEPDALSGVLVGHVARTAQAVRELQRSPLMWHDAATSMSDSCLDRLLNTGAFRPITVQRG